jgi:peptidoglycan/LPS O-acetylase OafA/YrhL
MNAQARLPILPHLTALRFFAALFVFIHHVEQFKFSLGLANCWHIPIIGYLGQMGVILFFVLSGFLITTQLLLLKKNHQTVDLKLYFTTRAKRVLPLYALMLIIGIIIIPFFTIFNFQPYTALFAKQYYFLSSLFIILLPNVAILITAVPFIAHLWSVGSEIQFYIIIAFVFKYSSKPILHIISILIVVNFFIWLPNLIGLSHYFFSIIHLLKTMHLESFLMGSLAAWLFIEKQQWVAHLYNYTTQAICLIIILLIGIWFCDWAPSLFSAIAVAVLVLNWAGNKKVIVKMNYPILNKLGNCSYSMYMFHPLLIFCTILILSRFQLYSNFLIYAISLMASILVSLFSYHYFEKLFLNPKQPIQK